jgi:pilus assembly protein CpaC
MRVYRRSEPRASRPAWRFASATTLAALAAIAAPQAQGQGATPARLTPAAATAPTARVVTPVFPTAPCGRVDIAPVVQVSIGKSTVIKPASPIRRVLLGNPDNSRAAAPKETGDKAHPPAAAPAPTSQERRPGVAEIDILLLSPSEVYVLGKAIGSTNVVLLDQSGGCTAFDVVVGMDTAALQTVIGQLLPDEKGIRVSAAYDSVVLTGTVNDSGSVIRVMDLANAFVRGNSQGASVAGANPRIVNMMATASPQQVMLEVKVAEVSKSLIDKLGVQFNAQKTTPDWRFNLLADFLSGGNGIAAAVKSASGFSLAIDAQKDDGLVKVLAEPTIMAISGQEGRFNAGGKIFIPVSQTNNGGTQTITLEEKEFGVSVRFRPTVLDGGRINLELVTEVSELNREGIGIVASGVNGSAILPSFTSRKTATTVQLVDGQSFAIGGLIKNNSTANVKALPVLGELPVVGALFRSTEFQSDKSELVFVITPRLVKPLPAGYALPTDRYREPSRTDLMLNGRVEGRSDAPAPAPAAAAAPAGAGGFQVK